MKNQSVRANLCPEASIQPGTRVWDLAQVRERAVIGADCVIGRGAYIDAGVKIGDRVKIQNSALIYQPAVLEDGCFIGPAVVLTNDQYPRAVDPNGRVKGADGWEAVGVTIREGASVGARAVCVAPVTIGAWAMVGAGAVVTADVPAFALVVGVPARQVGWVSRSGQRLESAGEGRWKCPESGADFIEGDSGQVEELR